MGKELLNVIVWFEEDYSSLTFCLSLEFFLIFMNIIHKTKIRSLVTHIFFIFHFDFYGGGTWLHLAESITSFSTFCYDC